MTRRNATERWETKISNCEVTPHAIWPLAKSLRRDRPKATTAIHSPPGLKFLQPEKAIEIADCLKISSHHMTCVREIIMVARVHAFVKAGVPQGSVLPLTLNDTPQTQGVYLALFADDTCIYTTDREEGYVLRKQRQGLTSMESWCERWNIKIKEDKTQVMYFSHRRTLVQAFLTLKGQHVPFVNHVKYLSVIFKITWRFHIETTAAKALRIFLSIYPFLKSERLGVGTQLTLYKAMISPILTYACHAWEFEADSYLLKLQRLQNKVLRTTPTRDLHMAFKISYSYYFVTKLCREQATVILNHERVNIRNTGQGEARREYKRLKLGGGQAYDRSIV
jgi:hypothetical protein